MEKRDEFTEQHAVAMLTEKTKVTESNCRSVIRALNRNGFAVNEIVPDEEEGSGPGYGTIESLNKKMDRVRQLDFERQSVTNQIKKEWNEVQKKYGPIFKAIANAMEVTNGASDAFPDDDAGSSGSADELPEVRQDV